MQVIAIAVIVAFGYLFVTSIPKEAAEGISCGTLFFIALALAGMIMAGAVLDAETTGGTNVQRATQGIERTNDWLEYQSDQSGARLRADCAAGNQWACNAIPWDARLDSINGQ